MMRRYCLPAGVSVSSPVLLNGTYGDEMGCRSMCAVAQECFLYAHYYTTGDEGSACELRYGAFARSDEGAAADEHRASRTPPGSTVCLKTPLIHADFNCFDGVAIGSAELAVMLPAANGTYMLDSRGSGSGADPGGSTAVAAGAPALAAALGVGGLTAWDPAACARACIMHPGCTHYSLFADPAGACALYAAMSSSTRYGVNASVVQTCLHTPRLRAALLAANVSSLQGPYGAAWELGSDPGYMCLPPGLLVQAAVLRQVDVEEAWACARACNEVHACDGILFTTGGTCMPLALLFTGPGSVNGRDPQLASADGALAQSGAAYALDHNGWRVQSASGGLTALAAGAMSMTPLPLSQVCLRTYLQGVPPVPPPPPVSLTEPHCRDDVIAPAARPHQYLVLPPP